MWKIKVVELLFDKIKTEKKKTSQTPSDGALDIIKRFILFITAHKRLLPE